MKPKPTAPVAAVTPPEVRAARSYLRQNVKASSSDIPPRKFAQAAKEQNVGFGDMLGFITRLYAGGSNQDFFRGELLNKAVQSGK